MTLNLSIIGAGRVGQTLARAARQAGYEIVDVVCRSPASARRAVKFIGSGRAQASRRARLSPAALTLIATPDDNIKDAVELLIRPAPMSQTGGARGRAAVLHTSGALSSAALGPLSERGFAIGSCHPLQTFASPASALAVLRGAYFCIEGEAPALRAARRFVKAIGARSFHIPTASKSLYHAAAVLSSGGVTALLSTNLELLGRCGLNEAQARRVLLPLVEATVANLRRVGPAGALTGPVIRGDVETIRGNMEALAAVDERALALYRLLAARSLALVGPGGGRRAALRRIERLLEAGEDETGTG